MNWVFILLLFGVSWAIPNPQGSIRIVKQSSKNDLITQNEAIQNNPEPNIWNPIIIEPSSLTYGSIKGVSLTERDQQRHITDEEVETREEVSGEEISPENDSKQESNANNESEVKKNNEKDERPVQSETAALLGSTVLAVKGGVNPMMSGENDQLFPQVISGQRRLVEPQIVDSYALTGRSLRPIVGISSSVFPKQSPVFQEIGQRVPINVQQLFSVSSVNSGVKNPVESSDISIKQSSKADKKGMPQDYHYVIQHILPSTISLAQKQPQTVVMVPSHVSHVNQNEGQEVIKQVVGVQEQDVSALKYDTNIRGLHVIPVSRLETKSLHGIKGRVAPVMTPVQPSPNKFITEETSRSVPVINGQRVVGYQVVGSRPQIHKQVSIVAKPQNFEINGPSPQFRQQNIQYLPSVPYVLQQIPVSNIQQYYHLVKAIPAQIDSRMDSDVGSGVGSGVGSRMDSQIISYSGQPMINEQIPQYFDSSNIAQVSQLEIEPQQKSSENIRGIQGVQQIQSENNNNVVKYGSRITPFSSNQRSYIVPQNGIKSSINV